MVKSNLSQTLKDSVLFGVIVGVIIMAVLSVYRIHVSALAGARSYEREETGEVFLGGDYIELGISQLGSFGTEMDGESPEGFFGTAERSNIGMSTNPSGFGEEPDLRMDYFLPGSPEERWAVGYHAGSDVYFGSNALLGGPSEPVGDEEEEEGSEDTTGEDISDNVVTDLSSGDELRARSVGTFNESLETTQDISFNRADKFFRNEVTLKNTSDESIQSVRYMRSFDPDNTVDQGGDYTTTNSIPLTRQAGDDISVVVADTSHEESDPVFLENGSRSPILFYSEDSRARVSTYGFANGDPYTPLAYDAALPKGTSVVEDQAITIAFDVGTLAPGQSQTVVYYTSLDNQGLAAIAELNSGNDANGDGILDGEQPNVSVITSSITGKKVVLEVDDECEVDEALMKAEGTHSVQDVAFTYPHGLMNFAVDCGEPGYTTTVRQYYYDINPSGLVLRKHNPNTSSYFGVQGANVIEQTIYGQLVTIADYSVTDGGDLDMDGQVDGVIVDPAGLANQAINSPDTGIRPSF